MVAIRAQKPSAIDSSNSLQQSGILQRVLDYVGPGHWCFVAQANSFWRDVYVRVAGKEIQMVGLRTTMTCLPQTTTFSAVFTSPSRMRHAHAHGLDCTSAQYQRAAGKYADIATLEAAHDVGMQYQFLVMLGAARCNELDVVQFLRTKGRV
jgi:hypothetical protein